MSRLSTQVANRIAIARHLLSSVETHGDAVAREAARRVDALKVGTVREVLDAVTGQLRQDTNAMRQRELAYTAEQADDPQARTTRDDTAAALASALAEAREVVRGALGDEGVGRYALSGATPQTPDALVEHATNVISLLRQHPDQATTALGFTVETTTLAAHLEPRLAALTEALHTVGREGRELQQALLARDAAVETWSASYTATGALLEGIYRLADRPQLAARIRPTTRRARGLVEQDATDDADTDTDIDAPAEPAAPAEPELA